MFGGLKRRIKRLFSPRVEVKGIVSFEFRFTCGCYMHADCKYGLFIKDGGYIAYIKPVGKAERTEYAVDKDFVLKLEAVLAKGGVDRWNGFNKSDSRVLDGNSFDFFLVNGKGGKLSASGYMKWPKNYRTVKEDVEKLFLSLSE